MDEERATNSGNVATITETSLEQENVETKNIGSTPTEDETTQAIDVCKPEAEEEEGSKELGFFIETQDGEDSIDQNVIEESKEDHFAADDNGSVHNEPHDTGADISVAGTEETDKSAIEEEEGEGKEDDSIFPESEGGDTNADKTDSRSDSSRRTSKRTEELIQAAARDIIARIEHKKGGNHEENGEDSILSTDTEASNEHDQDQAELSCAETPEVDHEDMQSHFSKEATPMIEEGGDSSSQHEEVFSDRSKSNRSSLGSYDGGSESGKGQNHSDNNAVATRTPRVSDISQYDNDEEDFIPTARGTPRPPFRTPSDVRALQMSSPAPSVFESVVGSPRSSKRPFPTVSRLGSPSGSAQYSPKNRTPSRFKVKKEAPLVLLHATLLPLRWMWRDVVNYVDSSEMTENAKALRESWRMLQDRMGDTVLERGILLGHPQNDYEVLEERLLEALELPMRSRARILECGHYLGPSNESTLGETDTESEDEYDMVRPEAKRHWCNICKHEIRYDSLGPGKIFRVKVYASNGLMKAGAWAACWKEMERVDVEIEPVVEPAVQEELARLATAHDQHEATQQQQAILASHIAQQFDEQQDRSLSDQPNLIHAQVEIPSAQLERSLMPRAEEHRPDSPDEPRHLQSADEERRIRDEARYREIHGLEPKSPYSNQSRHSASPQPRSESYMSSSTPRSPSSQAAYEQRRPRSRQQPYYNASLRELIFQSVRVLMQDRKNVVIVTLSFFVLLLALRTSPQQQPNYDPNLYGVKSASQMQRVEQVDMSTDYNQAFNKVNSVPQVQQYSVSETSPKNVVQQQEEPLASYNSSEQSMAPSGASNTGAHNPCDTPAAEAKSLSAGSSAGAAEPSQAPPQDAEAVTEKNIVRVIETITKTETLRVKVTATVTDDEQIPEATEELVPQVITTDAEQMPEATENFVQPVEAMEMPADM